MTTDQGFEGTQATAAPLDPLAEEIRRCQVHARAAAAALERGQIDRAAYETRTYLLADHVNRAVMARMRMGGEAAAWALSAMDDLRRAMVQLGDAAEAAARVRAYRKNGPEAKSGIHALVVDNILDGAWASEQTDRARRKSMSARRWRFNLWRARVWAWIVRLGSALRWDV